MRHLFDIFQKSKCCLTNVTFSVKIQDLQKNYKTFSIEHLTGFAPSVKRCIPIRKSFLSEQLWNKIETSLKFDSFLTRFNLSVRTKTKTFPSKEGSWFSKPNSFIRKFQQIHFLQKVYFVFILKGREKCIQSKKVWIWILFFNLLNGKSSQIDCILKHKSSEFKS